MKRKKIYFVVFLIVLIFSCSFSTVYAHGVGGQAYFGSSGDGVTSIYADIKIPNYPYVPTSAGSCAWPLITGSGGSNSFYVQVGWWKMNALNIHTGIYYFYEINYGTANNDYQVYSTTGPAANSTHGYRVSLITVGSNKYFSGSVDGTTIANYNRIWNGITYKGTGVQFYEELNGNNATSAHFAGSLSSPAIFANLRAFYNGYT